MSLSSTNQTGCTIFFSRGQDLFDKYQKLWVVVGSNSKVWDAETSSEQMLWLMWMPEVWYPAGSCRNGSRGGWGGGWASTPEMKPCSSFLLFKSIYLTSKLCLINAPLLRKILDLPLIHNSLGTRVSTPTYWLGSKWSGFNRPGG